ncbi:MAG TPA: NAD-dependent epimerase/dehydratase family protein [Bacteroidales bacterium]|nr:NAD-dependent epimerase/dehydratase family protein [Bacteroidales bacterium]
MILVTGGTGLLGSHLLYDLTKQGKTVRALVRDIHATQHVEKMFRLLHGSSETQYSLIQWVEGDICDITSVETAFDGVEEVYHCAALVSFYKGDNAHMMKINAGGTANIVNACLKHGVRKLIYASSVSALGHPEKGETIDETAQWKPSHRNSGYAISKYSAEREVWRGIEEGLAAAIVNPSVILGISCKSAVENKVFQNLRRLHTFYTRGITGYVDVRDVSRAMILLMDSNITAQRYLISTENLSYLEFVTMGAEILGKKKPTILLNRFWLSVTWRIDSVFSSIIRKKPLFTPEIIRPLYTSHTYSSEKYRAAFKHEFIPIKQSLADGFRLLGLLREETIR